MPLSKMTDKKYDYIIVGAGGSGAVIARQLLEKCDVEVLVLEMGKNNGNDPNVTDAKKWRIADSRAETTQTYTTTREPNAGDNRQNIVRGRGWGGSTANGDLLALRPSQDYLEHFSAVSGVPLVAINSFYKDLERYIPRPGSHVDPSRGQNGKMIVTQLPLGSTAQNLGRMDVVNEANNIMPGSGGLADLMAKAFNVPGLAIPKDDYNNIHNSDVLVTTRQQVFAQDLGTNWLRSYTGSAFLGTDFVLPNGKGVADYKIRIIDRTRVTKIEFKPVKTKCEIKGCNCTQLIKPASVDAWVDNVCCTFKARCGVILAAGYIETPALLMRSGIGPTAVLEKLCIPKCIQNENVGQHLLEKLCVDLKYQLTGCGAAIESLNSQLALITNELLNSENSRCVYPENYNPCRKMAVIATSPFKQKCRWNSSFSICSFFPLSEGSIEIVAQDAFSPYNIEVPAFSQPEELEAFRQVLRIMAEQVNQFVENYNVDHPEDSEPLEIHWPCGDPSELCDAQLDQLIFNNLHLESGSSTARMGPRSNSVIDQKFQVYGTCGLYVADTSAYPLLYDGDSTWAAMAIGWQFADILAKSCPKRRAEKPLEELYSNCRIVKNCNEKVKNCIIEEVGHHPDPCKGLCDESSCASESDCGGKCDKKCEKKCDKKPEKCDKKPEKCDKKPEKYYIKTCSKKNQKKEEKKCCKYDCEGNGNKCRYSSSSSYTRGSSSYTGTDSSY